MINKKIKLGVFLLVGIFLMVSISAADSYSRSTTQYIQPTSSSNYLNKQGISLTKAFDKNTCQAGQDFVLQISPLGCEPTVVRSDLLESRNVPVLCQLSATKINPLIDVEAIESVSFKGKYPKEVLSVGFHPANAGIKTSQSTLLNSPILNNIGYVVVNLKKQKNESAMPDWVQGNMTARIKYDVKNAFGIGKAQYYLPYMSDEDWSSRWKQYGFWKGKGYLRADDIGRDSATISVYSSKDEKMTSVSLQKGKTSGKINIPGFYCLANLQLKLDGLQTPDTRAKFEIDGEDTIEVGKGEQFLDNKCSVRSLEKNGLKQKVRVYCRTDDGGRDFTFEIAPKVRLNIEGTEKDYELGQKVADKIYVGAIVSKKESGGKVIDTIESKDLIVYFYKADKDLGERLSDSKLSSISRSVESKLRKKIEMKIKEGAIEGIKINVGEDVFNNKIDVVGFAGAQNVFGQKEKLDNELKELEDSYHVGMEENELSKVEKQIEAKKKEIVALKINDEIILSYNGAIKSFDKILDSYSSLKFDEDEKLKDVSYGEKALYEEIVFAIDAGQKADAVKLCEKFRERYSGSSLLSKVESECDEFALSNSESASWDVLINGYVRSIRFKGIYEPSEEEYSAEVIVNGVDYVLTKNEVVQGNNEESVQLIDLDEDYRSSVDAAYDGYARVKFNYKNEKDVAVTRTVKLKENVEEKFGKDNKITLTKINLKKQAKVSVIPSIENTVTEANFTFKVGIEKRAIQLSPEQALERIENLNKTIKKWEDISEDLGKVVKGMKAACLGTSAVLTVKNFFQGFSGKAAARHDVTARYRDRCVAEGMGDEMQKCLMGYSDEIDRDIERQAQSDIERAKFSDRLSKEGVYSKEGELTDDKYLDNIKSKGEVEGSRELLKERDYRQEAINLNHLENLKKEKVINDEEYNKKTKEIWDRLDKNYKVKGVGLSAIKEWDTTGLKDMSIQTAILKDQRQISYTGATASNWKKIGVDEPVPVQGITHKSEVYILELENAGDGNYVIADVYDEKGWKVIDSISTDIKSTYSVKKFDKKSYNNKYKTPQVIYYEIGSDKGRPAIVPVDVDKGFYAATTAGFKSMDSYDNSGMPSYFFLCNVMENGIQEFNSGNDECVGVRVGSNKADGALKGLTEAQTNEWAKKAISAMRCASRGYKAGVKSINCNGKIAVGNPALNVPGTQCTSFMSPEDCALLFNVCDPVICPESRCDFGGAYPVSNVVQSGILGSALLCLPNFGTPAEGGVIIPVCLTGINAGIDSLLSIYTNYRDCLQHGIDTGESIGVCDEIHSIYLCEFFWKQAIPFMNLAIPKVLQFVLTGGRGGGEYLQVEESWANAANSVNYFTNYYGANAYAAFKARTTDEVGTAVCNNFISARYPASGDFFDALIEPDSPSQFHGWFSESTFSTATVPPTSQYKVFFHIFAGNDAGVYYSVYLKSPVGSSFYRDAPRIDVASGYIAKGDYASETKELLDVSGYKELCINVQGYEECGFKEVSTSFALDYVNDAYVKDQAERTDIKSEKECISGSASLYSMATGNLQAGVEAVIDPRIYDQGIVRVCATSNPGEGTDITRWIDVGTCGNNNLKCWLDKDSVGEAVNFNSSLGGLENISKDALEKLKTEGKYLSKEEFEDLIKKIEKLDKDYQGKIDLIESVFEGKYDGGKKVLLNKEKVKLWYLKARAYVGKFNDFRKKGVTAVKPGDVEEGEGQKTDSESAKWCKDNCVSDYTSISDIDCVQIGKESFEQKDIPNSDYNCCCRSKKKGDGDGDLITLKITQGGKPLTLKEIPYDSSIFDERRDEDKYFGEVKVKKGNVMFSVVYSDKCKSKGYVAGDDLMKDSNKKFLTKEHGENDASFEVETALNEYSMKFNCYEEDEATLLERKQVLVKVEKGMLGTLGDLGKKVIKKILPDKTEDRKDKTYDFKSDRTEADVRKILKDSPYSKCNDYLSLIMKAFVEYELPDPLLLVSVMWQESKCEIVSVHNDEVSVGLMGITKRTFDYICGKEFAGLDGFDDVKGSGNVNANIFCGAFILKEKYNQYKDGFTFKKAKDEEVTSCKRDKDTIYYEWEAALRGYNGWGCGDDDYVKDVIERFEELSK